MAARHAWVRRVRNGAMATAMAVVLVVAVVALRPGPPGPPLEAFHVEDDPMVGVASAPMQVVLFEGPSCEDCAAFHKRLPHLLSGPVSEGGVAIWFLSAPAASPLDHAGAIAQECAQEHGGTPGYMAFTQRVYENQSGLDEHVVHVMLQDHAAAVGVPEEVVMRCYYAEETAATVQADGRVAAAHGASMGQAFVIRDHQVTPVPVAGLADYIEAER